MSEEAVRARMQDLTDGAKNMTISDDLEKTEKERMDIFYALVKKKLDAGVLEKTEDQKELLAEAERLEIKTKAPLVLMELLFDQNALQQVNFIQSFHIFPGNVMLDLGQEIPGFVVAFHLKRQKGTALFDWWVRTSGGAPQRRAASQSSCFTETTL